MVFSHPHFDKVSLQQVIHKIVFKESFSWSEDQKLIKEKYTLNDVKRSIFIYLSISMLMMTDCLHVGFKTIFRIRSSYSIVRFVVFSRNNKVDTIFWRINNLRYYIHTLAPQCYMIDILLMICNVQIFADTSRIWCLFFFFSRLRQKTSVAPRTFHKHTHERVLITKMTSCV